MRPHTERKQAGAFKTFATVSASTPPTIAEPTIWDTGHGQMGRFSTELFDSWSAIMHFPLAIVVFRMATIVGIEVDGGAVVAGDRRLTEGGTVKSESKRHVFDFGAVGAAAVGDSADVDEFRRRLESEARDHETQHGEPMSITRFANVASDIAAEEGVEAVVAARDDDEIGRVRGVGSDGGVLTDATVAFGSGAQLALGVLEGGERGISLDSAEERARDAIDAATERDTGTGEEVDTYRLDNDPDLV